MKYNHDAHVVLTLMQYLQAMGLYERLAIRYHANKKFIGYEECDKKRILFKNKAYKLSKYLA